MRPPAHEGNKDGIYVHEANETKEKIDVYHSDKNPVVKQSIPSKRNELIEDEAGTTKSSNESSDGSHQNAETKASSASSAKWRKIFFVVFIIFAVLFVASCAGALIYVFVLGNPENESIGTVATGTSTRRFTRTPTWTPTKSPSNTPTLLPTRSGAPTISVAPTKEPTSRPSAHPTISNSPSYSPTSKPSTRPTVSDEPSNGPTSQPSSNPTSKPSDTPSRGPSNQPSDRPTNTHVPSNGPTRQPSNSPTTSDSPSSAPTNRPSSRPTVTPSGSPTVTQNPTEVPSIPPTRFPTRSPTRIPTPRPTLLPTPKPTPSPTPPPTLPPEEKYEIQLRNYLENDFGVRITSNNANQAISLVVEEAKAGGFNEMPMAPKLVQRYVLINMELALFGSSPGQWGSFKQNECSWTGITCNGNREVTHIRLLGRGLQGNIPSEIGLLKALVHLDLASNNIQGSIPEELYKCVSLKKLYLYQNRLSGTISDKIVDLWDLKELNLSSNRISGRIPTTMRSNGRGIYKIRTFNVYDNQMTGPIPAEGSRLRQMYYMDLGRNRFSGTIPPMDEYVRLRYLYLDHNQFTGQLPRNIINVGHGRLKALAVNDNRFTGTLPGEHTVVNELMQFTAQNNQFTAMTSRTCTLNVMHTAEYQGQSAEFKSDCDICVCGRNDLFCKYCYN